MARKHFDLETVQEALSEMAPGSTIWVEDTDGNLGVLTAVEQSNTLAVTIKIRFPGSLS